MGHRKNKIEALKTEVLDLNDQKRATLASELLYSLPATLQDPYDGVAEALKRDRELSTSDSYGVTWDELKRSLPLKKSAFYPEAIDK